MESNLQLPVDCELDKVLLLYPTALRFHMTSINSFWSDRKLLLSLAICCLLSFVVLAYPLYVIRPFRHQGATELVVALAILRFRPILEIIFRRENPSR